MSILNSKKAIVTLVLGLVTAAALPAGAYSTSYFSSRPDVCSPNTMDLVVNQQGSWNTGSYNEVMYPVVWSAYPDATNPSGAGRSFSTAFTSPGTKYITASGGFNGSLEETCAVNVSANPVGIDDGNANPGQQRMTLSSDISELNPGQSTAIRWSIEGFQIPDCKFTEGADKIAQFYKITYPTGYVNTVPMSSTQTFTFSCRDRIENTNDYPYSLSLIIAVKSSLGASLNLYVNGNSGSVNVNQGDTPTVSWDSTGVTSCTITATSRDASSGGGYAQFTGLNGSGTLFPITGSTQVNGVCTGRTSVTQTIQINLANTVVVDFCSPNSSTARVGQPINFTSGSYIGSNVTWHAPEGNPVIGSGNGFTTSFNSPGVKQVIATVGVAPKSISETCTVVVDDLSSNVDDPFLNRSIDGRGIVVGGGSYYVPTPTTYSPSGSWRRSSRNSIFDLFR